MVKPIELIAQRARAVGSMTENIPSPCISVCRMDAHGAVCEGCLRSLDEIRLWSGNSDAEKKTVWASIAQRIEAMQKDASAPA